MGPKERAIARRERNSTTSMLISARSLYAMEPKTENDPTDQTPYQPAIQRARERIAIEEAANSQGESKTIPEPELNETNEATTTANIDISSGQSADIIYEGRSEDQLKDAIRIHRIEKRLSLEKLNTDIISVWTVLT